MNNGIIKGNILEISLINKISAGENSSIIQENSANYDEPLIKFVDNILQHALYQKASDIHIEPYQNFCRIRFRQDGILHEIIEIPIKMVSRLIARLKVLSKLDISEKRLPQDGRFLFLNHDIRISTCPTLFGEKIVLRILNSEKIMFDVNNLGFLDFQKKIFLEMISKPQNMILVTGPTGSGKTVTLYTALDYLNSNEKNISTIEDPIEIQMDGINQINIHPKIGLDFSTILKGLLRQDPDIIMLGEIRDLSTAEIALQAAQTGHLVLSSLHTNSAIDALSRLRSMGVPHYHIANSISLVIAQRLIRKLCEYCKQPEEISQSTLKGLGYEIKFLPSRFYRSTGCSSCLKGYIGRIAIYEMLLISDTITQLINSHAHSSDIFSQAIQENFIPLKQAAFEKVIQGITSLSEINRVLQ